MRNNASRSQTLEAVCPRCNAQRGMPCLTKWKSTAATSHAPRIKAALKLKRVPEEIVREFVLGFRWDFAPPAMWVSHPADLASNEWKYFGFIDDHTGQSWAGEFPVKLTCSYEKYAVRTKPVSPPLFKTSRKAMEHFPIFLKRARLLGVMSARKDLRMLELEERFGHLIC